MGHPSKNVEVPGVETHRSSSKRCLVASAPKTLKPLAFLGNGKMGSGVAGNIAFFLLKSATLEMVRRFSRDRCPFLWRGLQALQLLCYPPFRWIQRWAPFGGLVKSMQTLSRPILFLSVATAFSDRSECAGETPDHIDDSQPYPESQSEASSQPYPESQSEASTQQLIPDERISDELNQNLPSEDWLLRLHKELERHQISLPERMSDYELHGYYTAANGDITRLLSSIKKTIRWRETYNILSVQELEEWSNLVFWHGRDVMLRPCLIVRLGLACSSLASHDRPRFSQAIVSQIEYGVLQLVSPDNPQITVLVDCERLSPLRFPMQMMRSCSALLQAHYPNRLGCLFVIRLPPVARVIAQTIIQILKPVTRKKLRFEGEMYQQVLSEYLQTLPSYLGGQCKCSRCSILSNSGGIKPHGNKQTGTESSANVADGELFSSDSTYEPDMDLDCNKVLRTAIMGFLMVWLFIVLIAGFYDPESSPLWAL